MNDTPDKKPHVVGYIYDPVVERLVSTVVVNRLGYTLHNEATAECAIPHIPKADVVISDVTGGGYEIYMTAREHNKPIIMIDGGMLDIQRTPDALILPKPFSLSDLEKKVRKCAEGLKPNTPQ